MSHQAIVNIYNFVRKSHEEPSRFIKDDFDTVENQLKLVKQYGFPGTYALKHDALMDDRYLDLLMRYTDSFDDIDAWWEITGELCKKAGVSFKNENGEVFDNRVNTAYSLGYLPKERCALLDAYMEDFKKRLGYYPKTIGSWVIDIVTLSYAHQKYGTKAAAICRDQMATDGFTLWGGYVNGVYYPSKKNEYIPASTLNGQLNMPVFRLLGPDPIRCFEERVRETVRGVYSLEPSCTEGRNPNFISWMFERLTDEDTLGISYAQVGQENNFLWENMKAGLTAQLAQLHELAINGKLEIETMANTAERFCAEYRLTPPVTYNASVDYEKDSTLKTMWYACRNYRISFLAENDELFIRDWFVYRDDYESRYLDNVMKGEDSLFDALPLMFPQLWQNGKDRPKVLFLGQDGHPLKIKSPTFTSEGQDTGILQCEFIECSDDSDIPKLSELNVHMTEDYITCRGASKLYFNYLPALVEISGSVLKLMHNNFCYYVNILEGVVSGNKEDGITITAVDGKICINLSNSSSNKNEFLQPLYEEQPEFVLDLYHQKAFQPKEVKTSNYLLEPVIHPENRVYEHGTEVNITIENISADGEIYYTMDGTTPSLHSQLYTGAFKVYDDTVIKSRVIKHYNDKEFVSITAESKISFTKKALSITSLTTFDPRKVFNKEGAAGLLNTYRGSNDYQDGNWLGTLDTLCVTIELEDEQWIDEIVIGFITHHRSGILYPNMVKIFAPNEQGEFVQISAQKIPDGPYDREIETMDVVSPINRKVKKFQIVAEPHEVFPQWSCYRGLRGIFTMSDSILIH